MMTVKTKGRTTGRARELIAAVRKLVATSEPPALDQLGELSLLHGVRKFPQRVKCATLAWRALEQAILEAESGHGGSSVSTEAEEA
jgi:nitrogen fixation NifU-like protein